MSKRITVSYEGKPSYDIFIERDFETLQSALAAAGAASGRKACIVTDTNLSKLHLAKLEQNLKDSFGQVFSFVFPAGEESKNLDTVQTLYEELIGHGFDRRDVLIAFGGGVTGDLTGFAAATYLRGVDFVQIPTSLLSQVDSSIGGKTGVDFSRFKNMVGAFYQPKLVYMNLSLLSSLPKEQFVSGMGEILKHGLIRSAEYFSWIRERKERILALDPPVLEEMIAKSCQIKKEIVERDPKEKGERALLNFGHTVGHAIEKLSGFSLSHGECVSIGMAAACRMSRDFGQLSGEACEQAIETLSQFGLPVSASGLSAEDILSASKSDKKMISGKIKFILLRSVGDAYINPDLCDAQILSGISSVLKPGAGGKEEKRL